MTPHETKNWITFVEVNRSVWMKKRADLWRRTVKQLMKAAGRSLRTGESRGRVKVLHEDLVPDILQWFEDRKFTNIMSFASYRDHDRWFFKAQSGVVVGDLSKSAGV